MIEIFGRSKEIEILQETLDSRESEFLAITGRRRIGKTFLIKNFYKEKIVFSLTGVQKGTMADQLANFAREMSVRQKKKVEPPKNWQTAFWELEGYIKSLGRKKKKVLFIDELPWLHTARSGCILFLGHFWNSYANWETNTILVISGSATSVIIDKVFNDRGGLHNRVTKRIFLKPFTLFETKSYLQSRGVNMDFYQLTTLYMAIGGIPYYLKEIKKDKSAAQCIQELFFTNQGLLKGEFENLYHALFANAESCIPIIEALAKGTYGLTRTQLLQAAKIPNAGSTTRILTQLIECEFIEYLLPRGVRSNKGKYLLIDLYSRFYLRFVQNKKINHWMTVANTAQWYSWAGYAFEIVCLMHIKQIKKALGISGISSYHSTFYLKGDDQIKGSQLDLIIDRRDRCINLCEIKFTAKRYSMTKAEADNLRHKAFALESQLPVRKLIFPTMITTYGCHRNMHYLGVITNEVTLEGLFS